MKKPPSIEDARNWFAEDLRLASPVVHNPAIIDAFAKVPRELFLGEGPWWIHPRQFDRPATISPTADPRHIYHDVLVSIDHDLGINNGLPSLWAYYFDQLAITPGATVLQVGAGVGYFTAILAELVSPKGRVVAYEIDDDLAKRATANLSEHPNVKVIAGDAVNARDLPELDVIVVFAGATHVPEHWLSNLSQSGRIAVPLTADDHWGFMLKLEKRSGAVLATSLGRCGFFHCESARRPSEALALKTALAAVSGTIPPLDQMRFGRPEPKDATAWYVGDGFWLSKA